ncbi:M14 family zinc carboxypeptidase [Cyclobacterium jeungdonense]|uniref:M14 family zinc carboxypeptidase n=1 Tax=Cyclobacterium jeungdonense TaxID=708087 RepID=A0ABT8CFT9_9BACT|nr:M14 family zinc carboxypeptidase [Cyclobacterium jeungdonense]MDN3690418.1 M14 family zinc carboxypeptidase [Cyclobacterium jeungdonense]
MNKAFSLSALLLTFCILAGSTFSQPLPEPGDPENPSDIPEFYKSRLSDIEAELELLQKGKVERIAYSAGGLPLYAIFYGEKEDLNSQANYNSAVAARNPAFFAEKTSDTKPVVYFIGPVHGQEGEGISGLVNLLHIAETGSDYRGREWPELQAFFAEFRVIIVPSGNPDGRRRNPYDTFKGLPEEIMTKYGQGTQQDGTLWRWPGAKSLHPMKGDVGILGAYFNDNGINIMHDDFFDPMAAETKAIMQLAKEEAPDLSVSLHSCSCTPFVIQNSHAPLFMKKRIADFAQQLNQAFIAGDLPHRPENWGLSLEDDDPEFPPRASFNLVSALHHASGTMSFTFESPHGTLEDGTSYEELLDIQLVLYREIFSYIRDNRLIWEK